MDLLTIGMCFCAFPLALAFFRRSTKLRFLYRYYRSLSEPPTLTPTRFGHLRYITHKLYFRYLITGLGYILEPAERMILDMFMAVLLAAVAYHVVLALSFAWNFVLVGTGSSGPDRGSGLDYQSWKRRQQYGETHV